MRVALLVVLACAGGAGICVVVTGARSVPGDRIRPAGNDTLDPKRVLTAARLGLALASLIAGIVAFLVTGWPIVIPFAALAVVGLRGLGGRPVSRLIERHEAIATWTEMLRDALSGAAGLTQALIATASISPRPVREEVRALAARLSNGVALAVALGILADELADPTADVVVATLLLAATERAERLGDLLGALAVSSREEVAMHQAVEAARSSARSAVRTVTGFSVGFLGMMVTFARPYLAPYGSAEGQVVLAVVGCLFVLGFSLMAVMVRPRPAPRLFVPQPSR